MKLMCKQRSASKKSEAKQLRREGMIPAVLYGKGKESLSISVSADEFEAIRRKVPKGRLSTTVFVLDQDGEQKRAVLKEIQYDVVSYKVINLDFEELEENTLVSVRVPIEFSGIMDCVGIKLGGVLRQVIRQVKVKCLPEAIPESFVLNVASLGLKQTLRLSDINWPEGVRPLVNLQEVAVVIAKR